jgi:hypothetical protein
MTKNNRGNYYICNKPQDNPMTRNDYLNSNLPIGEQIAARCQAIGVSVNSVCKTADVASYKVSQWKRHNPASITALRKIEAVLVELERSVKG